MLNQGCSHCYDPYCVNTDRNTKTLNFRAAEGIYFYLSDKLEVKSSSYEAQKKKQQSSP